MLVRRGRPGAKTNDCRWRIASFRRWRSNSVALVHSGYGAQTSRTRRRPIGIVQILARYWTTVQYRERILRRSVLALRCTSMHRLGGNALTTAHPAAELTPDVTIRDGHLDIDKMIWIPGGTFRMGSDKHYPEEAPAHRVTVDGFRMDRYPVTNLQFREFVRSTKHLTVAEITPDPKDYPGMLPH